MAVGSCRKTRIRGVLGQKLRACRGTMAMKNVNDAKDHDSCQHQQSHLVSSADDIQ